LIVINCRKLDNQTIVISKVFCMLYKYDATTEKCPLPLVKMRVILKKMQQGDSCLLQISDKSSIKDIPKFLTKKGYQFTPQFLNDDVLQLLIKSHL
jgi:tRNA 2-thiouridine synthesizing protein A